MTSTRPPHDDLAPSPWVRRFVPLLAAGGRVLDLAAGSGRHTRLLLQHGHRVTALDRDAEPLSRFLGDSSVEIIECDLETGGPWPFNGISLVIRHHFLNGTYPFRANSFAPGPGFAGSGRYARHPDPLAAGLHRLPGI